MFHRILVNQFFSRYLKPSNARFCCRWGTRSRKQSRSGGRSGVIGGKVSIVGTTGSNPIATACLYNLLTKPSAKELCLIGLNAEPTKGELMEFGPCTASRNDIQVYGGTDYKDTKDSEVIVILPSVPKMHDISTNLDGGWQDAYQKELNNCKSIVSKVMEVSENPTFLVLFGPDVVYCHGILAWSKLNPDKIFGIGTLVESMHFAYNLSQKFDCRPNEVFAPIFGDRLCPVAMISQIKVKGDSKGSDDLTESYEKALKATAEIHAKKGYYGWLHGQVAANLVEDFLTDRKRPDAFTRYTLQKDTGFGADQFLSLPATGFSGIETEKESLKKCAKWLCEDVVGKLEY